MPARVYQGTAEGENGTYEGDAESHTVEKMESRKHLSSEEQRDAFDTSMVSQVALETLQGLYPECLEDILSISLH